jgi:hypothetical protein
MPQPATTHPKSQPSTSYQAVEPVPADASKENKAAGEANRDVSQASQTGKPSVEAGDIIKAWKHMSSTLPKAQANLAALMNSVKMIDIQHGTLILGLASDVLVSKLDKPDQIEIIQKLIRDEFGVDIPVRCMVTTAKGKIPPNVPQDGMVATAIQHGGEIVDM